MPFHFQHFKLNDCTLLISVVSIEKSALSLTFVDVSFFLAILKCFSHCLFSMIYMVFFVFILLEVLRTS